MHYLCAILCIINCFLKFNFLDICDWYLARLNSSTHDYVSLSVWERTWKMLYMGNLDLLFHITNLQRSLAYRYMYFLFSQNNFENIKARNLKYCIKLPESHITGRFWQTFCKFCILCRSIHVFTFWGHRSMTYFSLLQNNSKKKIPSRLRSPLWNRSKWVTYMCMSKLIQSLVQTKVHTKFSDSWLIGKLLCWNV